MSVTEQAGTLDSGLDQVVDDMSATIIGGQVVSTPREDTHETSYRTPAQGVQDGVDAERLGFRTAYLGERWNFKEAGVILGGVGAKTSRIGLGTCLMLAGSRHPQHFAAFGATMNAAYGPRCILGLGRGVESYYRGLGIDMAGYQGMIDTANIIRRLWRGETVDYDGPAGKVAGLSFGYPYECPEPPIYYGTFGFGKAAKAIAAAFDGAYLPPQFTPDATHKVVERIRTECERIDRDPAEVRIIQPVVTAADLDDLETRALAHSRAVTYLMVPPYSTSLMRANGWPQAKAAEIANHAVLRNREQVPDRGLHRVDLLDPAALVPDEWMRDANALGTARECVESLRRFRDAGADEVCLYGSTPMQNAEVIARWREGTS